MKRKLKKWRRKSARFLAVVSVVVFSISVPVSADPAEVLDDAALVAGMIEAYGQYYGADLQFVAENAQSAQGLVVQLYQEYTSSVADPMTMAALASAAVAAGVFVASNDFVQDQRYIAYNYSSAIAGYLDDFWNWVLSDKLGLSRKEDGTFNSDDLVLNPAPLYSVLGNATINGYNLYNLGNGPLKFTTYSDINDPHVHTEHIFYGSGNVYASAYVASGGSVAWCFYSFVSGNTVIRELVRSPGSTTSNSYNLSSLNRGIYYYNGSIASYNTANTTGSSIFVDTNLDPLFYNSYANSVVPSTRFKMVTGVDPVISYTNQAAINLSAFDSAIPLPDVDAAEYVPTPLTITTNIPWVGDVPVSPSAIEDFNSLSESVLDSMADNSLALQTVQTPDGIVDGGVNEPTNSSYSFTVDGLNFDFHFSDLWHYVLDWLSCITPFIALLKTVWGFLPYCMVVPVWATAVIVLVFGVYRRFIH